MNDEVKSPEHYIKGGLECIDVIRAVLGDGFEKYCEGNVLKYIWRWREKGGITDLEKAKRYIDIIIDNRISEDYGVEYKSIVKAERVV